MERKMWNMHSNWKMRWKKNLKTQMKKKTKNPKENEDKQTNWMLVKMWLFANVSVYVSPQLFALPNLNIQLIIFSFANDRFYRQWLVVANVISLIVRFKWNISSNFVSSINYFRSVGGSISSIIGPILTSISNQPNVRNDLCMRTHITYNEQENSKSASDCSHYAMKNKSEKHHHRPYIAFEAFFRLVF